MTDFATSLAVAKAKGPTGTQKSSVIPELSGQHIGLPGWSYFLPPERELADSWRGRQRTETVQAMLNDSQVTALWQAVRLPVHRYRIALDPRDADPVTVELLAEDLGVPLVDDTDERNSTPINEFSQRRHLDRAIEALPYGHAVFEQAGYIDEAGYWRMLDLPPVPQWTIDDSNSWVPDAQGKLVQVVQWGANPPIKLPADHLVVFTWQGAPGDPRGRSVLRPLYGSYLMRDRTMRVMGMSAERTGMGIPVGKVSSSSVAGAKEKMSALLGGMAAGHDSHLVLDTDEDIRKEVMLMGVTGATPDLVAMLRYHDEAMARAMLAMVMQTGTTPNGSQAGADNLSNLLAMFHDAVIEWYCDTMTGQLIRRWVERNPVGPGIPRLVWSIEESEGLDAPPTVPAPEAPAPVPVSARRGRERGTAAAARRTMHARQAATTALLNARHVGALDANEAVPAMTRAAAEIGGSGSPIGAKAAGREQDVGLGRDGEGPAEGGDPSPSRRAKAIRASFAATTGRDLRRDPFDHELQAGTDFAQLEQHFAAAQQDLASVLLRDRDELAAKAIELVEGMGTIDALTLGAALSPLLAAHAEAMDTGPIVTMLTATAAQGVSQVVGEAARQGVAITASIDYEARAELEGRELLRRMAVQVTECVAAAARTAAPAPVQARGLLSRIPARLGFITDTLAGLITFLSTQLGLLTTATPEAAAAGATSRANGAGRFAGLAAGPVRSVYASELLDSPSICAPCIEVDGTEYATVDDALDDYPSLGLYVGCEGRERCRGTVVAIFADEQPSGA